MFSAKLTTTLASCSLAFALGGSAVAQTLVVRAVGPSAAAYPAGRPVTAPEIVLQAGDTMTIIDGGATRTLQGPTRFRPGSANEPAARSNYTALVSQRTTRIARTGAARNAGGPVKPRSPNLWYVDIDKSAPVCVADFAAAPVLWRADMTEPLSMTLTRADGKTAAVSWAAGQAGVPWPEDLAPADGQTFNIARTGAESPTVVTFRAVAPGDTAEATASALIAAGCSAQLDVLVASLATPEPEAPATN